MCVYTHTHEFIHMSFLLKHARARERERNSDGKRLGEGVYTCICEQHCT